MRPQAGRAVVAPARGQGGGVEGVDGGAVRAGEGDVQRRRRRPVGDPEVGLSVAAEAHPVGAVHQHDVAERRERLLVEGAAGREVRHADVEVVDHDGDVQPPAAIAWSTASGSSTASITMTAAPITPARSSRVERAMRIERVASAVERR